MVLKSMNAAEASLRANITASCRPAIWAALLRGFLSQDVASNISTSRSANPNLPRLVTPHWRLNDFTTAMASPLCLICLNGETWEGLYGVKRLRLNLDVQLGNLGAAIC